MFRVGDYVRRKPDAESSLNWRTVCGKLGDFNPTLQIKDVAQEGRAFRVNGYMLELKNFTLAERPPVNLNQWIV